MSDRSGKQEKPVITLAKDIGYCTGVRNAIKLAFDTVQKYENVYMLGPIVHNEVVVSELHASGITVVNSLEEVKQNAAPILLRAHGTPPEIYERAKQKGLKIIDGTCPLVKEIHKAIKELEKEGRTLIVVGDHGHEEVEGIAAQVKKAIIISHPDEAIELNRMKKVGVVVQSTQLIENVREILDILYAKVRDLRFINTICYPTRHNQENIIYLAQTNDVMIIVGSEQSANTRRLLELSGLINPRSYRVNEPEELKPEWFENCERIGISGGASTPDYLIERVKGALERMLN